MLSREMSKKLLLEKLFIFAKSVTFYYNKLIIWLLSEVTLFPKASLLLLQNKTTCFAVSKRVHT